MKHLLALGSLAVMAMPIVTEFSAAIDRQDRAALESLSGRLADAAAKAPGNAATQYQAAIAKSHLAQVAMELADKQGSAAAAEAGIPAAQKAVALKPSVAEYHRVLGTLCGQVIPGNPLAGMKWGRCALDSVSKAVELDPKSAMARVSRGVGNYYMPAMFGGGADKAIEDFKKAIELDPNLAEAHLWHGIALRKAGRNADARAAIERSLKLNPNRAWAKQQLEKTPK